MIEAAMLLAALAWDLLLGEPPAAIHPVVWMGKLIAALECLQPTPPRAQLSYGVLMVIAGLAVVVGPSWLLLGYLREASPILYFLAGTYLLKCTFSVGGLIGAADGVRNPLAAGRLEEARRELRSLVSRDTSALDGSLIAAATVESLGENAGDSFVAPVLFFALAGVPGALAYRMINTFDAMVGYHGSYEYLGKFAARLDDLVNLVPARITALLLVCCSTPAGGTSRGAWRAIRFYRRATESPNAGWPMSAMAGALDVQLEKTGHYRLGDGTAQLTVEHIARACALTRLALFAGALGFLAWMLVRYAYWT